jgi:hypothetical protein
MAVLSAMARAVGAFGVVVLLIGCSDDTRTTAPVPGPAAVVPEQFSDIPLPRGYVFSSEADQLAVALAGGTVRRFDISLQQRETADLQPPNQLLLEMERDLTSLGWVAEKGTSDRLTWEKGRERLVLETGRTGGRTIIRLRLRPAPLAGP